MVHRHTSNQSPAICQLGFSIPVPLVMILLPPVHPCPPRNHVCISIVRRRSGSVKARGESGSEPSGAGGVHASESEHPDLFWGVRGGGGNFGIVTSFQYRLHPDRIVISGLTLYPLDQASEVLHFFREVTETAPDELT